MKKLTVDEAPPPWEWGKKLLDEREADPPYDMLTNALDVYMLSETAALRWCLGFWLFYHVGIASWLAEAPSEVFWSIASDISHRKPSAFVPDGLYPRGGYRRYFRGAVAQDAIGKMASVGPEKLVDSLFSGASSFEIVRKRVQDLPSFGYTMAFKMADMGERIFNYPISFHPTMRLPDEPQRGEEIAMEKYGSDVRVKIANHIKRCKPPGRWSREPNIQEIETIFCEWKHHLSGKFQIGQDAPRLRRHLVGFGDLASQLSRFLP